MPSMMSNIIENIYNESYYNIGIKELVVHILLRDNPHVSMSSFLNHVRNYKNDVVTPIFITYAYASKYGYESLKSQLSKDDLQTIKTEFEFYTQMDKLKKNNVCQSLFSHMYKIFNDV